ncbi:cupin domain-containing protein [Amycolatopsis thermoflava]|uniref:cupin domain-containing protein n=1 Tax=Amycolatopsis thermoflava TaxID=84480 RepID=UPI003D702BF6
MRTTAHRHGPSETLPANIQEIAAAGDGAPGILWRLREEGRQLDANLVHLPAGERIGTHAEPDLDLLLVVVTGAGKLTTGDDTLDVGPGSLVWLAHGQARAIEAGPEGLSYLTVHRRRPGMRIGHR